MKIFGAFLFVLPLFSLAQKNTSQARVLYQFSHVRDTTQPNAPYTEQMMLDFSSDAAIYKSYDLYLSDSVLFAQAMKGIAPSGPMKVPKATFEQQFYLFSANEHYIIRPWLGDTLVIKEGIEKIDWKITTQNKTIAGFNCTLAIGEFKGRQYRAWFCPDIPVKAGPWKLNGLPGLIIEAADNSGQVRFDLLRLQNINTAYISLPQKRRNITNKEWLQMKESIRQNPSGFLNGTVASGEPNQTSSVQVNNSGNAAAKRKSAINNPIELTD